MQLKKWVGWTKYWVPLLNSYTDAPEGPGAYMIAGPRRLPRAVGVDLEGILDIGESATLRKRLGDFVACAQGRSASGHMAGWRFYVHELAQHFPLEKLWVSWCATACKSSAQAKESEMLKLYYEQHFELPPLNFKSGKRIG